MNVFSSSQAQYGVVPKKEHHDDESRPFSDISREDDQDHKLKLESVSVWRGSDASRVEGGEIQRQSTVWTE